MFSTARIAARPLTEAWKRYRYERFIKQQRLPLYRADDVTRVCHNAAMIDAFRQMQSTYDWLSGPLFPVSGAVDHAFLVVLGRILAEHDIKTVIEFGAGQTTRVLGAWSAATGGRVLTIEHHPDWAERCRQWVVNPTQHTLYQIPLTRSVYGDQWYDASRLAHQAAGMRADLIIVDGPTGSATWSRAGFIPAFESLRSEHWVVLWDDVHRLSDLQSFARFVSDHRGDRQGCHVAFCQTAKTFGVACSDRFASARSYL